MKKIFALALGLTFIASISSCTDKDFDEKFYDESKTTTVTCEKLMTGAFYVGCDTYKAFGYLTYWRLYTWEHFMAQLNQQIGFNNESGSVYNLADSYATDRWNNFYEILNQFRLMQSVYNKESESDQANDRIFLDLTEVFVIDHLAQLVDVFGPVPYSKASYLGTTWNLSTSYPAYDDDEDIYFYMINRLGELYNDINSYATGTTSIIKNLLVAQDFINGGDLDKWLRYANSLRLRLAVHVAANGSLTSLAKSAIADCAEKKLVTNLDNGIFGVVGTNNVGDGSFYSWYRDGFAGSDQRNAIASQAMIDAMRVTGDDDPRLKVIYHPNAAGKFVGKSVEETPGDQSTNDQKTWKERAYASIDSVTFIANSNLKAPIFTPAETDFLLAEAYQQGYANGNAKTAFVNGVKNSIIEWYDRNMTSVPYDMPTGTHFKASVVPTDSEMSDYAEAVWDAYSNKLEAIMTQKWLHFGIMSAHESWTDIRRTGYPNLYYREDTPAQANKNIIQRIKYPNVEKDRNASNYNDVVASFNDSNETVLFWAKTLQ